MPYEAGDRHYVNVQDLVASVMYQLRGFLAPDGVVHFEIPISSAQIIREGFRWPLEQAVMPYRSEFDGGNDAKQKVIEFDVSRLQADKLLKEKAKDLFDWAEIRD